MKVNIHRHEFSLNCAKEDEELMRQSVTLIEEQLDRAKRQFHASDSERAALIAALMVAFQAKKDYNQPVALTAREASEIRQMNKQIDDILKRTNFPAKAQQ